MPCPSFRSWHGVIGLLVLLGSAGISLGGVAVYYRLLPSLKLLGLARTAHRAGGLAVFLLGAVGMSTGLKPLDPSHPINRFLEQAPPLEHDTAPHLLVHCRHGIRSTSHQQHIISLPYSMPCSAPCCYLVLASSSHPLGDPMTFDPHMLSGTQGRCFIPPWRCCIDCCGYCSFWEPSTAISQERIACLLGKLRCSA